MVKKRQAISVDLTGEQLCELERLWFYYGNNRPKHTPGNHGFIQALYERGIDLRPLRDKASTPTPECEAAVEQVLTGQFSIDHLDEKQRALRRQRIINIMAVREHYVISNIQKKDGEN